MDKGYIKFTEDRTTVEAEPQAFQAGRVYELPLTSCDRWKKRNAAVDATEAEFKAQAKADKKPAAEKKAGDEKKADEKKGDENGGGDGDASQTSGQLGA